MVSVDAKTPDTVRGDLSHHEARRRARPTYWAFISCPAGFQQLLIATRVLHIALVIRKQEQNLSRLLCGTFVMISLHALCL